MEYVFRLCLFYSTCITLFTLKLAIMFLVLVQTVKTLNNKYFHLENIFYDRSAGYPPQWTLESRYSVSIRHKYMYKKIIYIIMNLPN